MSLYEVSEIEPNSGFFVRDLIRGGKPVRVSERSASQTLKTRDKIGARVVTVGGKHLLSGGVLSFTMEAVDALMAGRRRAEGKRSPRSALALDAGKLRGLPDSLRRLAVGMGLQTAPSCSTTAGWYLTRNNRPGGSYLRREPLDRTDELITGIYPVAA